MNNMENFLMFMNYEIDPFKTVWAIRKNKDNEVYLDVGKCFGFKVFKDRSKVNESVWKIGVLSYLTNQKVYNKLSELNKTIFFDMSDAMKAISENHHAVILHYHQKYRFYDGYDYIISEIEKTNHGVIYHCTACNGGINRKIANKDICERVVDFYY